LIVSLYVVVRTAILIVAENPYCCTDCCRKCIVALIVAENPIVALIIAENP
jgi:hypothetical protein